MHAELKALDKASDRAYNALLKDASLYDACADNNWTRNNPVLYKAWSDAADKCRDYRVKHDLVGKRGW